MSGAPPAPAPIATTPNIHLAEKCASSTLRGSASESVRRLSKDELINTVRFLVGGGFWEIGEEMASMPTEADPEPGESFHPLHGDAEVDAWISLSVSAADAFAKYGREKDFTSNYCMDSDPISDACWTEFVTRFVGRAIRRPITPEEMSDYKALIMQDPSHDAGVRKVVSRALLSPDFVFHLESGASQEQGRVRLTDFEVASRISYGITRNLPDDALQAAAQKGELASLAQVEAHVRRLLATDEAKTKFGQFAVEWLNLGKTVDPSRILATYIGIEFGDTRNLKQFYRDEIIDYLVYVIWDQKGTFADVMTAPIAFPVEDRLAKIYRTSPIKDGQPVSTPDHPGLLTRAGLLASTLESTSPILRGVTLLRRVMCDELPSPDFSVVQTRLLELGSYSHLEMANHDIVAQTTAAPLCMACHSKINPLGFLMESFDALGMTRMREDVVGVDEKGDFQIKVLASYPLPGPQQELRLEQGLPTEYADVGDLVKAIGASHNARACMATRLFRNNVRRAETQADACALADSIKALNEDTPVLEALVASVANEDIFWRRDQ